MTNITTHIKNAFIKFCQQGVNDRASFIKNITVIGFILSSIAQVTSLVFNDKIPSKEKKFLIPQEIFDGIINSTIFYFITSRAVDFGKLLVLKKHVLPKSISNVMKSFTPNTKDISYLKDSFLSHLSKNSQSADVNLAKNFIDGMGVLTGISGAVLSNNIITPVIRNKLAAMYQKRNLPVPEYNTTFASRNFYNLTKAPKINTFNAFYKNTL